MRSARFFIIVITGLLLFFTSTGQTKLLSSSPPATQLPQPMTILTCEEPPTNFIKNGKITGITTEDLCAALDFRVGQKCAWRGR